MIVLLLMAYYFLWISVFHVESISLTVTPDYIKKRSTLTLTCDTSYSTTFNSSSFGVLASIVSNSSRCYNNDTSTLCSTICSCNDNKISYSFSPTSASNDSFFCFNSEEGNSSDVFVMANGKSVWGVLNYIK